MGYDEAFAIALQMQEDEADEFYNAWHQAGLLFRKVKRRRYTTAKQDPYQLSLGFKFTACFLIYDSISRVLDNELSNPTCGVYNSHM